MSKKEKPEKAKKLGEADAAKAVLEFLRRVRCSIDSRWVDSASLNFSQGNSPYNAQMVVDQLKGTVSKAGAEKV